MNRMRIANREIHTGNVFEIVIENFPDIIHSVDADGNIVMTNKRAEVLLGYSRAELLSMNIRDLYAEEILRQLEKGFATLKEEGEKTVESVLKARDGTRIPVEIRSFSIYDDEGQFIRTFSILRDIRRIKELQDGLIHAERLAAIGEMACGITHDISNPLNIIQLSAEILAGKLDRGETGESDLEELRELTAGVDRASESMSKLVKHLRHISHGGAEKMEVVDLSETLNDALFLLGTKTKQANVKVDARVEKGRYFTQGRPNQLEQVFANLISNACDAMAECEERELSLRITSCNRDGDRYWKCTIRDTGPGIAVELQSEVFKSFFTTKPKGRGTGLGLAIVRGIVKDHHGHIELVSEPGQGTTFTVHLLQAHPDGNRTDSALDVPMIQAMLAR